MLKGFGDINSFHYSIIAPFYHISAKQLAKHATLLHCRTGQKYGLGFAFVVYVFRARIMQWIRCNTDSKTKSQNTIKWRNGGIRNPLFDGLTYNTSGHFAHCSQLVKYPRVLYIKPSKKVSM